MNSWCRDDVRSSFFVARGRIHIPEYYPFSAVALRWRSDSRGPRAVVCGDVAVVAVVCEKSEIFSKIIF